MLLCFICHEYIKKDAALNKGNLRLQGRNFIKMKDINNHGEIVMMSIFAINFNDVIQTNKNPDFLSV